VTAAADLSALSHAEKDVLILALFERLDAAEARVAALEARVAELTRPPKTPRNFLQAASTGQKPNAPAARCTRTPTA